MYVFSCAATQHVIMFFCLFSFFLFVTSDLTKLQSNILNLPKPNSTKMNLTKPSKFDKFNKPKSTKLNKSKLDRFQLNWLDTWLTWLKNGFKNLRYYDWKDLRCLKVLRNSCTDPYLFTFTSLVVQQLHRPICFFLSTKAKDKFTN